MARAVSKDSEVDVRSVIFVGQPTSDQQESKEMFIWFDCNRIFCSFSKAADDVIDQFVVRLHQEVEDIKVRANDWIKNKATLILDKSIITSVQQVANWCSSKSESSCGAIRMRQTMLLASLPPSWIHLVTRHICKCFFCCSTKSFYTLYLSWNLTLVNLLICLQIILQFKHFC